MWFSVFLFLYFAVSPNSPTSFNGNTKSQLKCYSFVLYIVHRYLRLLIRSKGGAINLLINPIHLLPSLLFPCLDLPSNHTAMVIRLKTANPQQTKSEVTMARETRVSSERVSWTPPWSCAWGWR